MSRHRQAEGRGAERLARWMVVLLAVWLGMSDLASADAAGGDTTVKTSDSKTATTKTPNKESKPVPATTVATDAAAKNSAPKIKTNLPAKQAPQASPKPRRQLIAPSVAAKVQQDPPPEAVKTLEMMRHQDLEIFIQRTQDFKDMVDGMVRRVYERKRQHLNTIYEAGIQMEWRLESEALDDAIEYFKKFLKKYPDDPPYTPDAMYRLGELYYDKSYIDYQKKLEKYGEAQDRGQAEGLEPPKKSFDRTIEILQDLIARYPDYRTVDGAYYILGYCLKESGREEEARIAWLSGVCANKYTYDSQLFEEERTKVATSKRKASPSASLYTGVTDESGAFVDPFADCQPITPDSRFLFESWWLIGEYHFDYDMTRYGVETAIAAYKKLVANPKHKFYDKGLYKLAWSYFKADRYPEAIAAFSKMVEFSDTQTDIEGGTMRPEAIQYLAVCFFTDDWDVDSVPDEVSGIERVQDASLMAQDRPWTREVYERLGDIYSDNEMSPEAITLWTLAVERWPLELQAPFVQEKIAKEYGKLHEPEKEIAARSALDKYGPGSPWWKANEDHPAEQAQVSDMTRAALLEAAYHFHKMAQGLRQRGLAAQDGVLLERAVENYNLAADAYRNFIEQNPDTPEAYDISFNLAETLFWSGKYALAKDQYKVVRDSNLDDKYRKDAASMVIISLEELIKIQESEGLIKMREAPPKAMTGDPPKPEKIEIPALVLELMNEREAFLRDEPNHKDAGKYQYQTAQNYYRYGQWDEAKVRYEAIYDKFCKTDPIAYVSWQTLMNMASDLNDVDERERLALLQQKKECSVQGLEELTGEAEVIDIETVLGDVAMTRAVDMLKDCMDKKESELCGTAADALVGAVSKAPKHPDADKALHNAALAYEISQRFDSAMKLYGRIVQEYPESQYVGKCLFQQASAANNFFEYDKALENYRILADEKRFEDYENRVVSVYNSAFILTNLQRYTDAIPYWTRYSKEETDAVKSAEAAFNAADMYYKAKQWKRAIQAYDEFISRFERDRDAQASLVKASYRISLAEDTLGRKKNEAEAWQRTVDLYNRSREPGSMSAEYAAESQFKLIEQEMRKFETFKISGSMKKIQAGIEVGAEKVKQFEIRYKDISKYGRPEWSLAAEFRIGYAYEVFAKAMLNIPLPPLERKEARMLKQLPRGDREMVLMDLEDRFRTEMEKKVSPMEEKAKAQYKTAVDLARQGKISNEWTLLALERMNAYDPENYPRQHNGIILTERDSLAAPSFAGEVK